MKLFTALVIAPFAFAVPAPKHAEDITISISIATHEQNRNAGHAIHLNKEYPDCDETCPENVL